MVYYLPSTHSWWNWYPSICSFRVVEVLFHTENLGDDLSLNICQTQEEARLAERGEGPGAETAFIGITEGNLPGGQAT